jgi:putative nucleotidyltransferase with HDIG domain
MRLEALLKTPNALPTVPKVAAALLATFNQPDVDPMAVAQCIATDPVLTARLLKMANSSFFGLVRSVSSAREAMQVLGMTKVRSLSLAAILEQSFSAVPGIRLEEFWHYSINTANLAQFIAKPIRLDENTAFTAGLVHAIGELIMHVGMPEEMNRLNAIIKPLEIKRARAEIQAFGYSYADVGAELARQWRFPKAMVDAIKHQLEPFENGVYEPLAGVIHLAAWRARAVVLELDEEHLITTYPDPIGLVLGVDPDSIMEQLPCLVT